MKVRWRNRQSELGWSCLGVRPSTSPVERRALLSALNLVQQLGIFRASSFSHHLISLPSFFNVHQVLPCYRHRMPNLDTSKTGLRHSMITIDVEFSPLRVTTTNHRSIVFTTRMRKRARKRLYWPFIAPGTTQKPHSFQSCL
jgi:hypothetical protein